MNKRKILGTIIGILFWSLCVVFFTYAYYDWKSDLTYIVLGIEDLSVECVPGNDVSATNIGPVLNYEDGVISEFSIENGMDKEMAIDLRLDITNISDNLLVESLKYAVVTDITGGTDYDYESPILEGDFENFIVGSNLITTALAITPSITQKFQFIVYIDGNMYNDPSMQENSLEANLMIGNCDENAVPMDEMVYQAIYSSADNSLTFIHNKRLNVGDVYNNKAVTKVYTGFETSTHNSSSAVPWYSDGNYANITSVNFENEISPVSTAYWFYGFSNLTNINLENLDTSNVTNMVHMFSGCSSLVSLDVSNFNTGNVINMGYLFYNCNNLLELDVSNFDTSKVTSMKHMFENLNKIISLDVSNFDTSQVSEFHHMFGGMQLLVELNVSNFDTSNATRMDYLFNGCSSLVSLDVSKWNTSKVTGMAYMFANCDILESLDLGNFNTSNVTDMKGMFGDCGNLVNLDVSKFNTGNVTDMSVMFYNCSSLTNLDLSEWDTSKVTDMGLMFQNCFKLTATITIRNATLSNYSGIFTNTSNRNGALLTVNYTSDTESLVDSMIATKSDNSNVVKGVCVDCEV